MGMDPGMMGDPSMMGAMQGMYDMGMDPGMMGVNGPWYDGRHGL